MRVLLVRPYNKESLTVVPPLGLGYLATSLRREGFKVDILDCIKEKIKPEDFAQILKIKKPDVLGVTVFSSDLIIAKEYLAQAKKYDKNIINVIGGPHPSALPKECLEFFNEVLDFAFVGESEIGFPLFIKKIEKTKRPNFNKFKNIPGLAWRNKNGIIVNASKVVTDLDSIGFPSWDLIKPETYPHAPLGGFARRFPVGYLLTSRSCPFQCTFCAAKAIHGITFRRRSLGDVMKEVRYLIKRRGIKEIHILDDNFTLSQDFVKQFCLLKIKEKLNFSWNCSNGIRLDKVDLETLSPNIHLQKAGLNLI